AKRKENFVAMVNYMDKIVGRIVDKVDEIGQSENTIILFTADNGTNTQISSRWNGQEIKGGKGGMKDNGTHVPLIAYWKGHTPSGLVSNDLIDFTDFYATFAQSAGVALKQDDPQDGTSFLPQLMGKPGKLRDWVFCHYEPYWNKKSGQFVRNQNFKLYRNGDFFQVPGDLSEANNLNGSTDKEIQKIMAQLGGVMTQSPPAPQGKNANKNTKERPVYPAWKMKN
ncbi:sulfatase-like hydrolase/transferase, partial [bacterium]|nr:sulfatase-like hydrolase/transferase [bacterium]